MKTTNTQQLGFGSLSNADSFREERLTREASSMFAPATSQDSHNATSSQESAGGATHCNSQDGLKTNQCGLHHCLASHSVSRGREKGNPTSGICGRPSSGSSESEILQSYLANRLRVRLAAHGSMEYRLTWKVWTTPQQRRICALRASTPRTSGRDYTGWPTPRTGTGGPDATAKRPSGAKGTVNLAGAAKLAGWATPNAGDAKAGTNQKGDQVRLGKQAACGIATTSSPAQTGNRGGLNPAHSRWLMGFPVEWCQAAISAGRMLKRQRRSG